MAKNRRKAKKSSSLKNFGTLAKDGYALFKQNYGVKKKPPGTEVLVSRSKITITNQAKGLFVSKQRDGSAEADIIQFVSTNLRRKERVLIVIDENSYLSVSEPIPTSVERLCELQAARTAFENSPFPNGQALHFWELISIDGINHQLRVNILPKALIDSVLLGISNVGASIGGVSGQHHASQLSPISTPLWIFDAPKTPSKVTLASLIGEFRSLPMAYGAAAAALAAFFVMAASNIIYSNYQLSQSDSVSSEARLQLANRASAGRVVQTIRKMSNDAVFRVNLLDQMAESMDDQSYVTRYRLDDKTVEVSITSQSAADVLSKFADFQGIKNVRLLSTVTRDPENQQERFTIGLDLR